MCSAATARAATVRPDGTITTTITELPRAEWPVVIHDHHPGYISWEQYLANEQRLPRNDTRGGQRPAREGAALCQGIVRCGACGRSMSTRYQREGGYYECTHSRADHNATPGCRRSRRPSSTSSSPAGCSRRSRREEIKLALAAADEVADRRARSTRAVELRVERARYEAIRAERAFHACEPENRLVARSLETRWEQKLRELAEAEAELAEQNQPTPEPSREQLEALARDLPKLWAAQTTAQRDRKRLLRAMIVDVTLTSQPDTRELQVGIRWRSGAAEQHTIQRPPKPADAKRTPSEVIELIKRLAAEHTNTQIAEQLDKAGMRTSTGLPFDEKAVRWLRWRYRIGPSQPRDGEVTVTQLAERFAISDGTVYAWISTGKLAARRGPANRLYIPYGPDVEQRCRELVASSVHLPPRNQNQGCRRCSLMPRSRRSRTGSRKRWRPCFWSRWWNRGFIPTPMATGRDVGP